MSTTTTTPFDARLADRPRLKPLALFGGTPVSAEPIPPIKVVLTDQDVEAAVGVLRSGMLAAGKNAAEFERRFAEMTDARHALAVANGTCALQLAYGALIEPGDEVLCPAWSYVATASMLAAAGATIVWVDADPQSYVLDPEDAKKKITDRTVAIAATHIYGTPCDVDAIDALAADHGLSVIYDCAQSHMSRNNGKGNGAFGDACTYSFYATKNMTTGEGGMVTTNDDELAEKMRLLRSHGEVEKYTHASVGFNYRMTDLEAAIGLSQLDRVRDETDRRRSNARFYDNALATIPGLHAPAAPAGAEPVHHLYPVRIDEEAFEAPEGRTVRDLFQEALKAEGVPTMIHYPRSLTRQPMFDSPGLEHPPVSDRLARTLMCIPVHQHLTEQQVSQVGEALAKVAEALRV